LELRLFQVLSFNAVSSTRGAPCQNAGGFFGLWGINVMTLWRLNKILPMHGAAWTVALDVGINCAIAIAIPVDKW
jgi:hypothetical protein